MPIVRSSNDPAGTLLRPVRCPAADRQPVAPTGRAPGRTSPADVEVRRRRPAGRDRAVRRPRRLRPDDRRARSGGGQRPGRRRPRPDGRRHRAARWDPREVHRRRRLRGLRLAGRPRRRRRSGRPWPPSPSGRCCASRTTAANRWRSASVSPRARSWPPPRDDATGDLAVTGEAITTAARSSPSPGPVRSCSTRRRSAAPGIGSPSTTAARSSCAGSRSVVRLFALPATRLERRPASGPTADGPLVGRAAEMAHLQATLRGPRDRERRAVLVSGDAGMGKSRLVAEVEPDARGIGYRWTWTECVSYGRGEPYRFARLFAQAIADEHGIDSGQLRPSAAVRARDAMTRRSGASAARSLPSPATRLSPAGRPSPADVPADPTETARRPHRGRRGLHRPDAGHRRPARRRPGRRPLARSVERGDGRAPRRDRARPSLVVIATMRPGTLRPGRACRTWSGSAWTASAPPETAQLATIVARAPSTPTTHGGSMSGPRATRCSSARPSGPPSRTARSSCSDGRMALAEAGPPRLPLTLRAVLGARIDGLDEQARDVIGVASVIGIAFHSTDLVDLLGGRPAAPRPAGGRGADRRRRRAGHWRFSHPLVHDAAYAGMLASRRRLLHARLADSLEAGPGARLAIAVAVHRAAAGDAARAVPLLVDAATSSQIIGAAGEAAVSGGWPRSWLPPRGIRALSTECDGSRRGVTHRSSARLRPAIGRSGRWRALDDQIDAARARPLVASIARSRSSPGWTPMP